MVGENEKMRMNHDEPSDLGGVPWCSAVISHAEGKAAPRQCLMLKLKGVPQSEAQKLFVEVVFEVHGLLVCSGA